MDKDKFIKQLDEILKDESVFAAMAEARKTLEEHLNAFLKACATSMLAVADKAITEALNIKLVELTKKEKEEVNEQFKIKTRNKKKESRKEADVDDVPDNRERQEAPTPDAQEGTGETSPPNDPVVDGRTEKANDVASSPNSSAEKEVRGVAGGVPSLEGDLITAVRKNYTQEMIQELHRTGRGLTSNMLCDALRKEFASNYPYNYGYELAQDMLERAPGFRLLPIGNQIYDVSICKENENAV